jgi:hypothetical protein
VKELLNWLYMVGIGMLVIKTKIDWVCCSRQRGRTVGGSKIKNQDMFL